MLWQQQNSRKKKSNSDTFRKAMCPIDYEAEFECKMEEPFGTDIGMVVDELIARLRWVD